MTREFYASVQMNKIKDLLKLSRYVLYDILEAKL